MRLSEKKKRLKIPRNIHMKNQENTKGASVLGTYSPVEFEILLEKITIKQINSLSYTEFSEECENYPQQVVSFGEKKL